MKKFKGILILCLFITSICSTAFGDNIITSTKSLKSYIVKNYGPYGDNLNLNNSTEKNIIMKEFSITGNDISIVGHVPGDSPFDLNGTLLKSRISNRKIVGNLTDTTGNYKVIYFGIENDSKAGVSFDKSLDSSKVPVIKLYLLNKKNNNLVILETTDLTNNIYINNIFKNAESTALHEDEFWYSKLLKPQKTVSQKNLKSFSPFRSASVGIPVINVRTYTHKYNWMGYQMEERFTLHFEVTGISQITGSDRIHTTMRPSEVKTICWNNSSLNDDSTSFKVAPYTDTVVTFNTGSCNVGITSVSWANEYYEPARVTASLSLGSNSYSYNVGPVSPTVTYHPAKGSVSEGNEENLPSITKVYSLKRSRGLQLRDKNHHFYSNINVSNFGNNTKYKSSYFTVLFKYQINNGAGDHTFIKNESVPVQFYYTVDQ